MKKKYGRWLLAILLCWGLPAFADEIMGQGKVFSIIELRFTGPHQSAHDSPARDIDFWVQFQHQSSAAKHTLQGFWDGDGQGGREGNCFKIRFCPTQAGKWTLSQVVSNVPELNRQHQGSIIIAHPSKHPGFWIVDPDSAGKRWYMRSNGTHPYILGNTMYNFLTGYETGGHPSGNDIAGDIRANAQYYKKLRFGISGDRYPNPHVKAFLDDQGNETDEGDYSHRPNPRWFHNRVDIAVQTAYETDTIADLILAGPDTEASRSTLRARHNKGDARPFLKYMAARYGSYPHVWFCLCNEFEIKKPAYTEKEIATWGSYLRGQLAYPIPLSVHSSPKTLWSPAFDALPSWHDHQIIQKKIRTLAPAADVIYSTWKHPKGNGPLYKPTIDDELSYQGKGDKHTEQDTIESHLGAFLGGGYGTTGEKPGNKLGQYFRGKFNADEHSASDNLLWLRQVIEQHITFWNMAPDSSIFSDLDQEFRGMAWPGHEYVLGTNKAHPSIKASLPPGSWTITQYDVIQKKVKTLHTGVQGTVSFDSPDSRAVLFHFKRD